MYCTYTYIDVDVFIRMKNIGTDTAYNAYVEVELSDHIRLISLGNEMGEILYTHFKNNVVADLNLHLSPGDSGAI